MRKTRRWRAHPFDANATDFNLQVVLCLVVEASSCPHVGCHGESPHNSIQLAFGQSLHRALNMNRDICANFLRCHGHLCLLLICQEQEDRMFSEGLFYAVCFAKERGICQGQD